jgi:uncharacterized protein
VKIGFDPAKRARNLAKHGLDPSTGSGQALAEAGEVLAGFCETRIDDRFDYGEERWMSVGMLRGRIVVCVWTETSEDEVRIISLRKANRHEQEVYLEKIDG